jgi:hypothetical protein
VVVGEIPIYLQGPDKYAASLLRHIYLPQLHCFSALQPQPGPVAAGKGGVKDGVKERQGRFSK